MIKSLAERISKKWEPCSSHPSLPEITAAASLAHHGFLRSAKKLYLRDVDLASVPAEHLASLASCMTDYVVISNVSNTDLTTILDSSKSEVLRINKQSLSTEETQALVRAMANVERVFLGDDVTIDISTLVTYSGRGKCKMVEFNTVVKYREEVRRWVQRISWRVLATKNEYGIVITASKAQRTLT